MTQDPSNRRQFTRHRIAGSTAGQLLMSQDQTSITCEGVDLSSQGMGVATTTDVPVGERILLAIKGVDVEMIVMWRHEASPGQYRLGLKTVDPTVNLEDLFFNFRGGKGNLSTDDSLLNGALVRAERISVVGKLRVSARTFGITGGFDLMAENISRSGLLLVSSEEGRLPFRLNTLLELTIDPEKVWADTPIECLGKVVRVEASSHEKIPALASPHGFGVQLVELSEKALSVWDRCLDRLQKQTPNKKTA